MQRGNVKPTPDAAPASTAAADQPAVSKLAAKVAHELNNPLDAVLRFVSLAQRKARNGDYTDLDRYLADAQFGLERMAEILRELMDIGRQTNDLLARPEKLPLPDLVAAALRTSAAFAEQKRITLIVRHHLPPMPTPPHYDLRLTQVLSNLLKNAIEASPENAAVRITVQCHEPASLVLSVEDSGPGIAPELLPLLFTPFITTKPRDKGHGLGLAISHELMLALGGALRIINAPAPRTGVIATLTLPLP